MVEVESVLVIPRFVGLDLVEHRVFGGRDELKDIDLRIPAPYGDGRGPADKLDSFEAEGIEHFAVDENGHRAVPEQTAALIAERVFRDAALTVKGNVRVV